MEIVGYIAAVLIGITLGLVGSGGSILTVPVLVYLFSINAVTATSYSLFIVGLTSAVGSFSYLKRKMIDGKVVALFGIPSIISVVLTRNFVVPVIPTTIAQIGTLHLTKDAMMLLLFGLLMIAAAAGMIKKPTNAPLPAVPTGENINRSLLIIHGFAVGFITGLIGVGGGFLIIPALVMLLRIRMKDAVGNSLVIIAANSLIGFFNSHNHDDIDWKLLFSLAALAIIGIFIGIRLSKKIDGSRLKPIFGWFVLLMGMYIILKETIFRI